MIIISTSVIESFNITTTSSSPSSSSPTAMVEVYTSTNHVAKQNSAIRTCTHRRNANHHVF